MEIQMHECMNEWTIKQLSLELICLLIKWVKHFKFTLSMYSYWYSHEMLLLTDTWICLSLTHIWKKTNPKLTKVLHNRLPLKAPMASPRFRTEWMSNQWQLGQSRRVLKSTPQGSTENLIKHPIIWLAEQPEGPIILLSVALCWNDSCCLSVMTQKS